MDKLRTIYPDILIVVLSLLMVGISVDSFLKAKWIAWEPQAGLMAMILSAVSFVVFTALFMNSTIRIFRALLISYKHKSDDSS